MTSVDIWREKREEGKKGGTRATRKVKRVGGREEEMGGGKRG